MRLDLSDADLRGQYVGDLDLEMSVDLKNADLEGATYRLNQKFPEGFNPIKQKMVMDLDKTDFSSDFKNYRHSNFWDADMNGINMNRIFLHGADLSDVKNLEMAKNLDSAFYNMNTKFPEGFNPMEHNMILVLRGEDLKNMDFRGMDLRNTKFSPEPDLQGVDFRGAILNGQDFREAKNWKEANWEGAYFDYDTQLPDISHRLETLRDKIVLDLREVDLRDVLHLEVETRSSYTVTDMAKIYHNWFERSSLRGPLAVDLEGADLRGAGIGRWDWSRARNLEKANLEGVIYHSTAKFPEGFNPAEHGMIKNN